MVCFYVYAGQLILLALCFYKHHYKLDPLFCGLLDIFLIANFIFIHVPMMAGTGKKKDLKKLGNFTYT